MFKKIAVALVAAGGLVAASAPAYAGGHVSLSVGVGLPFIGGYVAPAPAYYGAAPVYVSPPAYYGPPAVVYAPGPVYYGPRAYYGPRYYGVRGYYRGGYGHWHR